MWPKIGFARRGLYIVYCGLYNGRRRRLGSFRENSCWPLAVGCGDPDWVRFVKIAVGFWRLAFGDWLLVGVGLGSFRVFVSCGRPG